VLLVTPAYLEPAAHVLNLTKPDPAMWSVILAMSLVPVLMVQTAAYVVHSRWRRRS
jgi:hypothetical protein